VYCYFDVFYDLAELTNELEFIAAKFLSIN
jgi:hypothetical protein